MHATPLSRTIAKSYPSLWKSTSEKVFDKLENIKSNKKVGISLNAVDHLEETDNNYKVFFRMAGYAKDQIDVNVKNGKLIVEADSDDWLGYYKTQFSLPKNTNKDSIKASVDKGILKITIPKDSPDNRSIEIE